MDRNQEALSKKQELKYHGSIRTQLTYAFLLLALTPMLTGFFGLGAIEFGFLIIFVLVPISIGFCAKRKNRHVFGWVASQIAAIFPAIILSVLGRRLSIPLVTSVFSCAVYFAPLIVLATLPFLCPKCRCHLSKNEWKNGICPKCKESPKGDLVMSGETIDANLSMPQYIMTNPSRAHFQRESKKCPSCAEHIKLEALICRFCGHKFDEAEIRRTNEFLELQRNRDTRKAMLEKGNRSFETCERRSKSLIVIGAFLLFIVILFISLAKDHRFIIALTGGLLGSLSLMFGHVLRKKADKLEVDLKKLKEEAAMRDDVKIPSLEDATGMKAEIEKSMRVEEFPYFKKFTSLTNLLKTILWISLGISVISLLSDFMQMNLLSPGTFSQASAEANDSRQRVIGILFLVALVITGIAFLKWIHRANKNCHGFGAQGMEFTPGWSIGYYFIPFINLYKPYRAMKEIWRVSTNPTNWQNESGSALLGWWWALWFISNCLWQASWRMSMRADTISSLRASTKVSILSGIIDIPLYIVAVSLITTIYAKQEKLVKKNVND